MSDQHSDEHSDYNNLDCEVEKVNVGANIKAMREKIGMQQAVLAEKTGVTQSMICQIERGTKTCSVQLGVDIANVLGCELGDLIKSADTRSA